MMLRMTIGVMLVAASVQAVASTSGAITDRPGFEMAEDVRAGSPTTPAVWTHPAVRDLAQTVTAPPTTAPTPERALSANPLWGISLTSLSGTRDRPIFSPSRRPPAVAVAPAAAPKVAVAKPKERERPQLNLVGTVASSDEAFGIFLDSSTKAALRLKIGEDYQGWKLRSVQGREATLEKDQEVITLELPQPGGGQAVSEVRNDVRPPTGAGKLATSPPRLDRLR
jgi:general secretion pathway protein N